MRRFIFGLALVLCVVSCSKASEPWNNNPNGQNNGNDNWNTLESTFPAKSGVIMDDEATAEDNVANTKFDGDISIVYGEDGVETEGSVEGVEVTVDGTRVTVTNNGDKKVKYILSGTCGDGSFKLYSNKKQAIVLKNLSLTNTNGAAVNNQSKKRTFVVVEGTNLLADGNVNASGDYPDETEDEDMKAAFFSEGQLVFSGSGSLKVNAVGKAGITSDDYVRFMSGSDVTVTSAKGHGVRGKDAIIVTGGNVNVTLESGATGKKCFSSDSLVYIGGGVTTLANNASAGTVDGELTGASCIKADQLFVIQGGELSITAKGKGCKGINGDGKGFFEGGKVYAKVSGMNYGRSNQYGGSDNSVSAKAIKFDGPLEFSASEVVASASWHEAIETKSTLYISGGQISATSADDAINSSSAMTISDGIIYAFSTGNDGLDANGNLIIKGGTVYAVGCGNPEVGIDANTEGRYKFYLQGGNVIAVGGVESNSSVSQPVISTSWTRNVTYSLCDSDKALFSFKVPEAGGTELFMSAPSLKEGTSYSLKTGASVSGGSSYFDDRITVGGTASGGSETTVTASTYTSSGGMTGPGGGPGGRW